MQSGTVLVVEDDVSLRRTLRTTLTALDFGIGEANSGEEALMRLRMVDYDLVLLDTNMPGMGGVEACKQIRQAYSRLPIMMLTVRDNEEDKIAALESGADDYVTKPFQIGELTARIRTCIRRYRTQEQRPATTTITVGEIALDPLRRIVSKGGVRVSLTGREFTLLSTFMEYAGMPLTHVQLLTKIGGASQSQNREYLRVLISDLRKKIESDPANPKYLLTESYYGYRFRDK